MAKVIHVDFGNCRSHEKHFIDLDFFVQGIFLLVEAIDFLYNKFSNQENFMKFTIHKGIFIALALASTISCGSTPKSGSAAAEKELPAQAEAVAEPTAAELYSQKVNSCTITLLSSPKQTTKGRIFTEPYTLEVKNAEGQPIESFELFLLYPSSRVNGEIHFEQTMVSTDSEGKASFLPPVPEYSFNSEVSFFPKGDMNDPEIAKIASEHTVKAPFKVQTDLKAAGGTIAVVDFNQNGKAILSNPVSSSNLLMTLMKLGFTKIGNAPQDVSEAVIQNDESKIFARARAIAPSFIIFGTVRIDSNEKTEEGCTCTLTGSIKSMNSKTGEVTFSTVKTVSVTEKNDWNALANARKLLAEQIAGEIKYGI